METFAERTARIETRDEENMIFEYMHFSQYKDGSVLNCLGMITYTAQEVVDGAISIDPAPGWEKIAKRITKSLIINAKFAIKDGTTHNRSPFRE
jgi:hypothetical protein